MAYVIDKCARCNKTEYEWYCYENFKPTCRSCSEKCLCSQCKKRRADLRKGEWETEDKKEVFCPYCGKRCRDEYEGGEFLSLALKGDSFDWNCDHCERDFDVSATIEVEYSTSKKD